MKSGVGAGRANGFTLVELMVVVIIIAILAAVAAPIYTNQARRARLSEAIAALGTIHHTERVYYTEHNVFLAVAANNIQNDPTDANAGLGLDLSKNTYFDGHCFSVVLDATYQFIATCDGSGAGNAAPRRNDVTSYRAQMRGNGTSRQSYDSGSTWTAWQ